MTEAYPLAWPEHWPRTARPEGSRFRTSLGQARDGLLDELFLMNARNIVISSNLALRRDGLPYANQRQPEDCAVAVYFTLDREQQCIPCDRWMRVEDNIQAIRKTVEALRGLDRWGAKNMVKAAFSGFQALPPPEMKQHWSTVLHVGTHASLEDINCAYRNRAKESADDEDALLRLNLAVEQARQERGAAP